jgi:cardiolipin synthase
VGFVRLALLPVFLVLGLASGDGRSEAAAAVFGVIAAMDYLDGIVARATGQYSRLGTLLDPFVDRLLVLSGVIVAWRFEILPRWALAVLVARELFMLVATELALRRGLDVRVSMLGRLAVWPTMSSLFLAMASTSRIAAPVLYLGLAMTLATTATYVRDGLRALRGPST